MKKLLFFFKFGLDNGEYHNMVFKPTYYSYSLFKDIDLSEKADWLLVKSDGVVGGGVSVIFERKILKELLNELKTNPVKECNEATTPFYIISFYRNGERVESLSRCSWINSSYDLDILSKNLISATWKFEKVSSIKEYNSVLNTLKQKNNVYLLYPDDPVNNYSKQLRFTIDTIDKNQDKYQEEKWIENEFRQLFKTNNYLITVNHYSSDFGQGTLGYLITIDCDNSFLQDFDTVKLKKSKWFQEISNYSYTAKVFEIAYFQWRQQ